MHFAGAHASSILDVSRKKMKSLILFLTLLVSIAHGEELTVVSHDPKDDSYSCSIAGKVEAFEGLKPALAFLKKENASKVYMRSNHYLSKSKALTIIKNFKKENISLHRFTIPVEITVHIDSPYRRSSSSDEVVVVAENEINDENLEKAHEAYLKHKPEKEAITTEGRLTSRWSQFLSRSALQS